MERFVMAALFTHIEKAFIKMSTTHPYAALRVQFERRNDDVQN